jgi:hypothetical protein
VELIVPFTTQSSSRNVALISSTPWGVLFSNDANPANDGDERSRQRHSAVPQAWRPQAWRRSTTVDESARSVPVHRPKSQLIAVALPDH